MLFESSQRKLQRKLMRKVKDRNKWVVAGHSYDTMKLGYRRPKERELKSLRWERTKSELDTTFKPFWYRRLFIEVYIFLLCAICDLPFIHSDYAMRVPHFSFYYYFSLFSFCLGFHSLSFGCFIWFENSAGSCSK